LNKVIRQVVAQAFHQNLNGKEIQEIPEPVLIF